MPCGIPTNSILENHIERVIESQLRPRGIQPNSIVVFVSNSASQ